MNKAICGSKESATPNDELETWKETVLLPTLARYSLNDIYNGDETALFYKSLPHRTYCFDGDKPAGSAKHKDRLTLLIITNMDGSDHRKLSVIGKSKTPHCLQKKYKMQVKEMAVDWYASKNAWMTGEIHHQIMSKLNNEMKLSNHHILYVLATEDPLPAPALDVWNRVQRWLGDVQFDEFAASEPEAGTAQPLSDQDIVNIVLTENDAQDESDEEFEEEVPSASAIKTSIKFLTMIDQQKAFLK